ncbi:MAG TPA: hypothetical protein VIM41_00225, partial [Gammaproteobacteria bacterium]
TIVAVSWIPASAGMTKIQEIALSKCHSGLARYYVYYWIIRRISGQLNAAIKRKDAVAQRTTDNLLKNSWGSHSGFQIGRSNRLS